MYFESRSEAGEKLAAELVTNYRYEDCAVIALSDGGVLVAEQIAASLHCIFTLLLVEDIEVPGESMSFGGVSQDGQFTYNGMFSAGEIDEYTSEFHGYLEEKKRESFQKINRFLGDGELINHTMLRDRIVILVSDGINTASIFSSAAEYLKPVRIRKLIIAAPVASSEYIHAVDSLADELHVLDVKDNYIATDHYFNDNTIPSHEETIEKINKIVLNWR